jgi:hypothetical protein
MIDTLKSSMAKFSSLRWTRKETYIYVSYNLITKYVETQCIASLHGSTNKLERELREDKTH